MRGELREISLEEHLQLLQEQQLGRGGVVLAGVPIYSGAIPQQVGGGFWSSVWSGIKSIGKAILPTLARSGASLLSDISQPNGADIKKAGMRRLGEASSDLLSMASEAVRRRAQGGGRRIKRRRRAVSATGTTSRKRRRRSTGKTGKKKYKKCKKSKKRSVKRGRRKRAAVSKKRKTTRITKKKRGRKSGGGNPFIDF